MTFILVCISCRGPGGEETQERPLFSGLFGERGRGVARKSALLSFSSLLKTVAKNGTGYGGR